MVFVMELRTFSRQEGSLLGDIKYQYRLLFWGYDDMGKPFLQFVYF
jgi:hypothetical protein